MITFNEMDTHISIREQLRDDGGPIALANLFTVAPEDPDRLLAVRADDAF